MSLPAGTASVEFRSSGRGASVATSTSAGLPCSGWFLRNGLYAAYAVLRLFRDNSIIGSLQLRELRSREVGIQAGRVQP